MESIEDLVVLSENSDAEEVLAAICTFCFYQINFVCTRDRIPRFRINDIISQLNKFGQEFVKKPNLMTSENGSISDKAPEHK